MLSTFRKITVFLVAVGLVALVVSAGSWASREISKREFETEARNVVSVLRSGVSVADGLLTSLDASDYKAGGTSQLDSHLATVLAKYEYITGLGRFEKVGGLRPAKYPLLVARFRSTQDSAAEDLIGFNLASVSGFVRAFESKGSSSDRLMVVMPPPNLQRSERLWALLKSETDSDKATGGYLLELDIEEMASSGGVSFDSFGMSISTFTEQSEFESSAKADVLYQRRASPQKNQLRSKLLSRWVSQDRLLSSFEFGDKTLILEVWKESGLSGKFILLLTALGAWLAAMFLVIVHLHSKRRSAQKMQRRESQKLYESRHRAAVTLASIDDAVITTDVDGTVLYANGAAESLLSCSLEDMHGRVIDELVVVRPDGSGADNSDAGNEALTLRATDGSSVLVNRKESDLKHSDGVLAGKVIVLRDVTVEHELTQALQHKVNHDSLTGLSNRFYFEQQMSKLFESDEKDDLGHAVCFIDLDRFKEVNDTCGHAAGDELLIQIARAFEKNVRETDLVARLGGDEFGIVLRNCQKEDALQIAERIREYFQSFFFDYAEHVFPVRCSIGIVHFRPSESDMDSVVKAADTACFDAKKRGRNSICEGSLDIAASNTESEVQWLPKIKDALDGDKFILFVQSIASISSGRINRHEVLLRMADDDGELVCASAFMKTAERYDLAHDIDKWVISNALEQICNLSAEFSDHQFAINLSMQSINAEGFIEYLRQKISLSGVCPSRISFDIKESDTLNSKAAAAEFCRQLQAIGCSVALDDFGAAMTSLSTIKSLPVNVIKIDGSLITDLSVAPSVSVLSPGVSEQGFSQQVMVNPDLLLVRAIHSFASAMGLTTVAEQVDNHDCLAILKQLQIDYVQGYVVAMPMILSELSIDDSGDFLQSAA